MSGYPKNMAWIQPSLSWIGHPWSRVIQVTFNVAAKLNSSLQLEGEDIRAISHEGECYQEKTHEKILKH